MVVIKIDRARKVKRDTNSLFIGMNPFKSETLSKIKALPVRFWDAETKTWEAPIDSLSILIDTIDDEFEITGLYQGLVTSDIATVEQVNNSYEFKTKPFEHQIQGFNYGLNHNNWLLADEQGLGKTKQVIDIACAKKLQKGYRHCLILCGVNGLKWNWLSEIKVHSNESGYILGQKLTKAGKLTIGSGAKKLEDLKNIKNIDSYFLITNIESLRDDEIAAEINKLCADGTIGLVAFDECHKAKNPNSIQGKALLKLNADSKIAMTGTPLMNSPLDLFVILKWLGYENHSFYKFRNYYCEMGGFGGYQVMGYRNLNELNQKLNNIMLRRLKDEVLDLPEKTLINEYVDMEGKQKQIYKAVLGEIKSEIETIKNASLNPLSMLIRLRQATGFTGILDSKVKESAKLDRMVELVEESKANNKKVVIFSNWTDVTTPAFERLTALGFKGVQITGDTKDSDRQDNVNRFQNDSTVDFIIGTTSAMGTGLTLTAGSVEIFLDEPWNMANKAQAIDRCHRIGQKTNITVYTLLTKDTIDERINDIVNSKGELADRLVDGKLTSTDRDALVDYLLS